MKGFAEVKTQAQLTEFEDAVVDFVDAVFKEVRILNRAYVNADRSLQCDFWLDAQIIVQSQNLDHEIELILVGLRSLEISADMFEDGVVCSLRETGGWPPQEIKVGAITTSQLFYRRRPRSGRSAVFGPELPSPLAVPAVCVRAGWRQCSECCDAWEEDDRITFSRCPACGELTELKTAERSD